jgi:protein-S-isoprenylcysteine O-methyltransferase Ste14
MPDALVVQGAALMAFPMSSSSTPFEGVDRLARGAAGTTAHWQAQVFALVYVVFSLPIIFYLLTHPALLRRRFRAGPLAEREPRQRIIMSLFLLCIPAMGVVLALDYASGLSHVPVFVVLLGDLLVAAGLVLVWLVFRANPFAAAAVNVEPGQTVVSTGPYALVRHPMYSAALLLFLGIPIALGSWWGLVLFPPLLVLVIWRLLDEERYLSIHLRGYRDYRTKVTRRLIPSIW